MGCSKGVYSRLLRAVFAVILIGKQECFSMTYNYSTSSSSVDLNFTSIISEATISPTKTISFQTYGNFAPSSSFSLSSVMTTKTVNVTSSSSSIMVPTTSFSTQQTSVLQQASLSTSSISHGFTSTVSAALGTSAPTSQITPARTSRSVQATSSVILVSKYNIGP